MSTLCPVCGYSHLALGVQFVGRTLIRRARLAHKLRAFGGAWGFSERLWNAHRGDFDEVLIRCDEAGSVWHADRAVLAKAQRVNLNPFVGPQIVLRISDLAATGTRTAVLGKGRALERLAETQSLADPNVQLTLFPLHLAPEPGPRRRRGRKRHA